MISTAQNTPVITQIPDTRQYRGFTIRLIRSGIRSGYKAVWFDSQFPATGKRGDTETRTGANAKRRAAVDAIAAIDTYRASLQR